MTVFDQVPKRLRIGSKDYAVRHDQAWIDRHCLEKQAFYQATHDPAGSQIVLADQAVESLSHAQAVLMHEVLHACFHVSGRDIHDGETACLALEHTLTATLQDNPSLVEFLTRRDDD